jgi:hypothetical protein
MASGGPTGESEDLGGLSLCGHSMLSSHHLLDLSLFVKFVSSFKFPILFPWAFMVEFLFSSL